MSQGMGLCTKCRHFKSGLSTVSGVSECVAFPEGIPEELLVGAATHFEYVEGQAGEKVFEKADHVAQASLDAAIDNLDLMTAVGMVNDAPE